MPDLASESQSVVGFLASIDEGIDRVVKIYDRIAPEWLADLKVQGNWTAVRSVFPDELLVKQRILNDPQILRRMELHGLVGHSLQSKISFLKKSTDRFRDLIDKESTDLATKKSASSWLLRVIGSYLDSLAGVFPGLVSVEEFTRQMELAVQSPL